MVWGQVAIEAALVLGFYVAVALLVIPHSADPSRVATLLTTLRVLALIVEAAVSNTIGE